MGGPGRRMPRRGGGLTQAKGQGGPLNNNDKQRISHGQAVGGPRAKGCGCVWHRPGGVGHSPAIFGFQSPKFKGVSLGSSVEFSLGLGLLRPARRAHKANIGGAPILLGGEERAKRVAYNTGIGARPEKKAPGGGGGGPTLPGPGVAGTGTSAKISGPQGGAGRGAKRGGGPEVFGNWADWGGTDERGGGTGGERFGTPNPPATNSGGPGVAGGGGPGAREGVGGGTMAGSGANPRPPEEEQRGGAGFQRPPGAFGQDRNAIGKKTGGRVESVVKLPHAPNAGGTGLLFHLPHMAWQESSPCT